MPLLGSYRYALQRKRPLFVCDMEAWSHPPLSRQNAEEMFRPVSPLLRSRVPGSGSCHLTSTEEKWGREEDKDKASPHTPARSLFLSLVFSLVVRVSVLSVGCFGVVGIVATTLSHLRDRVLPSRTSSSQEGGPSIAYLLVLLLRSGLVFIRSRP